MSNLQQVILINIYSRSQYILYHLFIVAKETEEITHNICPQFVTDQCHIKKCSGLHFSLPYCWQFKRLSSPVSWCNFKKIDCENIEKHFCDVNCTAAELNISTNVAGSAARYVRRNINNGSIYTVQIFIIYPII